MACLYSDIIASMLAISVVKSAYWANLMPRDFGSGLDTGSSTMVRTKLEGSMGLEKVHKTSLG